MSKGLPINSFTEPEPESEDKRDPTQSEMIVYATELLMATIHEAADKIAAATLASALFREELDSEYQEPIMVGLFQGYNGILKKIRAMNAPDATENGGNDGEGQENAKKTKA